MIGTVRLDLPARPEYLLLARLAVTGVCRAAGGSEEALADLKLAVTEAVANVARHAYPDQAGRVMVELTLAETRLDIAVIDDGKGFDPALDGQAMSSGEHQSGMGLSIVSSLADTLSIEPGADGRGTCVRFGRSLSG